MRTKRRFLQLTGISIISSTLFPVRAFAQSYSDRYEAAYDQLQNDLAIVFAPAQGIQPSAEFVDNFLGLERQVRIAFFEQIEPADAVELAAELDPAVLDINLAVPDEVPLIVVSPLEIEQIKILRDMPPVKGETLIELVLNIFVDTVDWRFVYEGLRWLATEDETFSAILEDTGNRLAIRDMPGLIGNLIKLIEFITGADVLARIAQRIGMNSAEVRRRLYKSIGLRLIPYAGWAFTTGCLAVCIYAYRQRIESVILR